MRSALFKLFHTVLQKTSLFYELSIEKGISGFCQIAPNGKIVFANRKLKEMAEKDNLEGVDFDSFFTDNEKIIIARKIQEKKEKTKMIRQFQWQSTKGNSIPVGLELADVKIGRKFLGSYAKITDLTKPTELRNRVFDRFLLGIVRLDKDRRMIYANKSFRDLMGLDCKEWKGMDFNKFIPDEENLDILNKQLKHRWEGEPDEYDIRLRRLDDKRTTPVRISASPEKDLRGDVTGTFGIIRSIVRDNVQHHIETKTNPKELLDAVSKELLGVVPFETFFVVVFSRNMKHVRKFFSYSVNQEPVIERRWRPMTPRMLEWTKQKRILSLPDIRTFFDQEEFKHLKEDPDIQKIISRYKSFIYYPIFEDERLKACVTLYSSLEKPYGDSHCRLLMNIPVDTAVLSALHYDEKQHLEFTINLINEMSSFEDDLNKIVQIITKGIANHYSWENVSIFKADRANNRFALLNQVTSSEASRIPNDYEQDLNAGILGLAYSSEKEVNVEDVKDPQWNEIYIPTIKATSSALCLPIKSGDLFWLLNIESEQKSGFSEEDVASLKKLIDQISVFIERAWLKNFLEKSMQETSDAVIFADYQGKITFINEAALTMMGYDSENQDIGQKIKSKPLADFFVDNKMADIIIKNPKIPNTAVTLKKKNGEEIKVLLSKFRLHEEFPTNIIIAKDLSIQVRLEELTYLKKMYNEIAFQTRTPLTLLFSWLNRIQKKLTNNDEVLEIVDKARRQLNKLSISFDRLAFYDKETLSEITPPQSKILFPIIEIQRIIGENFPESDLKRIKWGKFNEDLYLRGNIFQLAFCFETIFSYLLRAIPDEDAIFVKVKMQGNQVNFEIKGNMPSLSYEGEKIALYSADKTLLDMALGENIIQKFIEKNRGIYHRYTKSGNRITFKFSLPSEEN